MENRKWKAENTESEANRVVFSAFSASNAVQTICSACGAETPRDSAKFCRVCGKLLLEDYQPLDTLRASYRMQGKSFQFHETAEITELFEENKNSASSTASAFVVYSLVPYLGILFCPGAFVMGSIGAVVSYRNPNVGGGRTSIYSIVLSLVIFVIQILLWWLLYIIPELGK